MATQVLRPIRPVKRRDGGAITIEYHPEAASQTFKAGEPVYIDGNGRVAEFDATADNGTQRFYGFAAEDGHNDATAGTHKVGVYKADDDTVFEGNIYHTTEGNAVTAQTDLGTLLPLKHLPSQGSGIAAVDKENTAGKIDCCRIVGFSERPGEAVGDTYGYVQFIVEAVARQFAQ